MNLPDPIDKLIKEFSRLPSIGSKTAERIALYLLKKPVFDLERFSNNLMDAKRKVDYCNKCAMFTKKGDDLCEICINAKREKGIICIVAEISDLISIENSGSYKGLYHVLHGQLSPLDGIGPEHLSFDKLWIRLENNQTDEIIIATNPNFEGETTAMYIKKYLKERFPDIKITQLAKGIPQGGSVEYLDHITLGKALEGRREM